MADLAVSPTTDPNAAYTSQAISEAAIVQNYKDQISQVRNTEISLNQTITSEINSVQSMFDARATLIQAFKTDALAMFPSLAGQNMDQIMSQIPNDHPLADLWSSYHVKIAPIVQNIKSLMAQIDSDMNGFSAAHAIENNLFDQYEAWAATAVTAVPSAADIDSTLTALSIIPTAQDASLTVSLPAIEQLSPSAADMVTAQAVNIVEAQNDAAITGTAPIVDPSQVSIANSVDPNASSNIKPLGVGVLLAGLAYVFLSGEKKV